MIGPVTVLVVDEPAWTDRLVAGIEGEGEGLSVRATDTVEAARTILAGGHIDAVVSAYDLPDGDGLSFLSSLRESAPTLPFVIFTEEGNERVASEAISRGVSDYVVKDATEYQFALLANRLSSLVEASRARRIVDAAEARWREMDEGVNDVYFMVSADWTKLLYVNSAYEVVWGASTEELAADPTSFLEYIHPEDRGAARESMDRLSNGEATDIEYRVHPPVGGTRWVRGVSEPVVDDAGDTVRIIGCVRDVSRQEKRERRFQAVFEQSADAMVIADDDGEYVMVNEAATELFGMSAEDLVGRTVMDFAAPEYDVESAWGAFKSKPEETGLFPLRRTDGSVRIVEYEATRDVLPGEHLSILRDVTERVEQREALVESQARYQTMIEDVLDTSTVGTVVLDEDCSVVWINHAIEDLLDIDRGAVLGESARDVVERVTKHKFADPEEYARKVLGTYEENSATEEFEVKLRDDRTGGWRWLHHWSRPIRSGLYAGGRIEHYTDVTETKTRGRQLQVLERILRHNLQNKMNIVVGYADSIAAEATGQQAVYAERIARAATELIEVSEKERRIVQLINETVDRDEFDLTEPIREIVEDVRVRYPDATITADLPAEALVVAIPGVVGAIREVVENAVEHSGGHPVIDLSLAETPESVAVAVRDDNPPIPDLEKTVLRDDVEIDQLTHSRGLGLWLTNWVVDRSGGSIRFDRRPGGNEVRIDLPTADSGDADR